VGKKEGREGKEEGEEERACTGCWWLMPVVLATWETEIGESQFEASPGK
jgi:hypothetical protein